MCGETKTSPSNSLKRGDRVRWVRDDRLDLRVHVGLEGVHDDHDGDPIPWVKIEGGVRLVANARDLQKVEPETEPVEVGQVRRWINSPAETITVERIVHGVAFYAYPPSSPNTPDRFRTRAHRSTTDLVLGTTLVAQTPPVPALQHIPPRVKRVVRGVDGQIRRVDVDVLETEEVRITERTELREGDVVVTAPNAGTLRADLVPVTVRREVTPRPAPGTSGKATVEGRHDVRGTWIRSVNGVAYFATNEAVTNTGNMAHFDEVTDFVADAVVDEATAYQNGRESAFTAVEKTSLFRAPGYAYANTHASGMWSSKALEAARKALVEQARADG